MKGLFFFLAVSAIAPALAYSGPPFQAAQVKGLERFPGSRAAREFLLKKGFLVSGEEGAEMADLYAKARTGLPVFITADAAWVAYSRALESAFRAGEPRKARRLASYLLELFKECARRGGKVYDRLALYLAVPVLLLEKGAREEVNAALGKDKAPLLREALSRIEQSIRDGRPFRVPFLAGNIDPLFRPESFYAESSLLSRYWKAWKWLQAAHFDMSDPREGPAGVALAQLIYGRPENKKVFEAFLESYRDWLGAGGEFGLEKWASFFEDLLGERWLALPPEKVWLSTRKRKGRKSGKGGPLCLPGAEGAGCSKEMAFFCRGETPVFKFLMEDLEKTGASRGGLPSGLDLLASGPLASPAGTRILVDTFRGSAWVEDLLSLRPPSLGEDLYSKSLKALRLLQGPALTSSEPVFSTPEWKDKMAWTQLAGWVSLEHNFALYRGFPFFTIGGVPESTSPGVVSPYPGFFLALSRAALEAKALLERLEDSFPRDYRKLAEKSLDLLDACRELGKKEPGEWTSRERKWMERIRAALKRAYPGEAGKGAAGGEMAGQARKEIEGFLLEGKLSRRAGKFLDNLFFPHDPVSRMKEVLLEVSKKLGRLGEISRKQWEGKRLGEKEGEWVDGFGGWLSRLALQCRVSFKAPFPSWAKVVSVAGCVGDGNPRKLYAGSGDPEALYIILEISGSPRLYKGGVIGYREFELPSPVDMNDSTWRKWLKEGNAPGPPGFTESFRVSGG